MTAEQRAGGDDVRPFREPRPHASSFSGIGWLCSSEVERDGASLAGRKPQPCRAEGYQPFGTWPWLPRVTMPGHGTGVRWVLRHVRAQAVAARIALGGAGTTGPLLADTQVLATEESADPTSSSRYRDAMGGQDLRRHRPVAQRAIQSGVRCRSTLSPRHVELSGWPSAYDTPVADVVSVDPPLAPADTDAVRWAPVHSGHVVHRSATRPTHCRSSCGSTGCHGTWMRRRRLDWCETPCCAGPVVVVGVSEVYAGPVEVLSPRRRHVRRRATSSDLRRAGFVSTRSGRTPTTGPRDGDRHHAVRCVGRLFDVRHVPGVSLRPVAAARWRRSLDRLRCGVRSPPSPPPPRRNRTYALPLVALQALAGRATSRTPLLSATTGCPAASGSRPAASASCWARRSGPTSSSCDHWHVTEVDTSMHERPACSPSSPTSLVAYRPTRYLGTSPPGTSLPCVTSTAGRSAHRGCVPYRRRIPGASRTSGPPRAIGVPPAMDVADPGQARNEHEPDAEVMSLPRQHRRARKATVRPSSGRCTASCSPTIAFPRSGRADCGASWRSTRRRHRRAGRARARRTAGLNHLPPACARHPSPADP